MQLKEYNMKSKYFAILATGICYAAQSNIILNKDSTSFNIELTTNAGTGYNWFLENYDSNILMPSKTSIKTATERKLGAPKTTLWEFKLKEIKVPTVSKIVFQQARPWEGIENIEKIFYIFIT